MSNVYRLSEQNSKSGKIIQVKPVNGGKEDHSHEQVETDLKKHYEELIKNAELELKNAQVEAERTVSDANQKIEQEYQRLDEKAKETFEQAKEQGYQDGFELGKKEAENKFEYMLSNVQRITEIIQIDYQRKLKQAESDILQIAVQSTEKILAQKLSEDPCSFIPLIKNSLEEVIDQPEVILHIHPEDYSLVVEFKEELELLFPEKGTITIYPNKEISKYGCRIESLFGIIDSSIDTQLEQLKKQLTELVN